MSKNQVLEYLEGLTAKELEEVFKNFVEYRDNTVLEEEVLKLEVQVEELQDVIANCNSNSRDYYGYYE